MQQRHRGFTLAEMLIVICMIGILATIALPNLRGARDRAEATALLERVRVVRTAITGEAFVVPDSLNAPAGAVPAPLADALADSVMRGEGGATLQLSGTGSEIWLTIHAPSGRGPLVLERAYIEAQREGFKARYQGAVLELAMNAAAAATVTTAQASAAQTAAQAALNPNAQPATATAATPTPPAVTGPPEITGTRGAWLANIVAEDMVSVPVVTEGDPNAGRWYALTIADGATYVVPSGPAAGLVIGGPNKNTWVVNTGNPNYGHGGYIAVPFASPDAYTAQRSDLIPKP